jgi:hypothetical protein
VNWIGLAQKRGLVEGTHEHGNEPTGSVNCWEVHE